MITSPDVGHLALILSIPKQIDKGIIPEIRPGEFLKIRNAYQSFYGKENEVCPSQGMQAGYQRIEDIFHSQLNLLLEEMISVARDIIIDDGLTISPKRLHDYMDAHNYYFSSRLKHITDGSWPSPAKVNQAFRTIMEYY